MLLHTMPELNLTRGELEVMSILWEEGELKPAEIQKRFPREIKNSALRSYLSILYEKGHVTRRLEGKAYYYEARTQRRRAVQERLRELVDVYCKGSVHSLLLNLAETEDLSDEDIEALKKLRAGSADKEGETNG